MNRAEDAQKLSFVLSFRRRGLPELSAHGWLPRMQPVFRNELQKLLREDFGFLRSLLQSLAKQLIEPSQDVYAVGVQEEPLLGASQLKTGMQQSCPARPMAWRPELSANVLREISCCKARPPSPMSYP